MILELEAAEEPLGKYTITIRFGSRQLPLTLEYISLVQLPQPRICILAGFNSPEPGAIICILTTHRLTIFSGMTQKIGLDFLMTWKLRAWFLQRPALD